jgi:2-polyprenyl-6-methoxyphenol hydroxylase-like FAD-dependent oxidoreductase
MASIIICGGGVVGLSAAMMLARDGHEVTVLEADPHEVPETPVQAWECWERKGVAQFRQPHNLFARFRHVCDEELPGMTERLLAAGLVWADPLVPLPPGITDQDPRAGDEALRFVTGRRPVAEAVIAAAAQEEPGVEVRRGLRVTELIAGRSALPAVPHTIGVRTSAGDELHADLVVDATGRRSRAPELLARLGAAPPHEQAEDSGFAYYTRYFTGPARPAINGPWLTPIGTITLLTLMGDNDTWSVTIFAASGDGALKELRYPDCYSRVVRACPVQAHWLDGEPITGVLPMAGGLDRYRRFVADGSPVVTGFAAVGDAWACTNPSAGRGLSVGLVHAQLLRRAVRDHLDDPAAFARAFDDATERMVAPFYWSQVRGDRARVAEMTALREDRPWSPPPSRMTGLIKGAQCDADLFRAFTEVIVCLATTQEVLARPEVRDKVERWSREPALAPPGPDRQQLLRLLSAPA